MHTTLSLRRSAGLATVCLAFAAVGCNVTVGCDSDEREEAPSTVAVTSTLTDEVADTLEGFFDAFVTGNTDALHRYFLPGCASADIDVVLREAQHTATISDQFGIAYSVTIDREKLVIEPRREDRVTVPAIQPDGTVIFAANGEPLPEPSEGVSLDLVKDSLSGSERWLIVNCHDVAADLTADDALELEPEPP